MRRVAFILSSGRTGTRFLAHYLDQNFDGVVARHEPWPARLLRPAAHAHMQHSLSRGSIARMLRWKKDHVDPVDADLYVESNPFLSGCIDVLGDVWENPIIIHIVRDPREQVRSSLNHGSSRGLKGLANSTLPFWYPDAGRLLRLQGPLDWLEKASALWTFINRRLGDEGRRYADYHVFFYEDLFDASHPGLTELVRVLGLDAAQSSERIARTDRINRARFDVLPRWPEWSVEQCRSLDRICGPLMREYGYGDEPGWKAKLGEGATRA